MKPAFAFFLVWCIALAATAQTKSATNSKDPRGHQYYEQAMKMFYAGDLHGSIEMLRKAIDFGSPEAEMELGWRYEGGYGVPQNFQQAFYWYDRSAKHHYAKGARALGGLYFFGKGVRQDYSAAFPLYEVAGWAGDHLAQYQLGYMCEHGLGVQADLNEAFQWYAKAAPDSRYPNAKQGEEEVLDKLDAQRFAPFTWLFQLLNSNDIKKKSTSGGTVPYFP
jgi:TPR repeat protein